MKPNLQTLAHQIRMYFGDRNIPVEGLTVILQVPTASAAAKLDHAIADEAQPMKLLWAAQPSTNTRIFEIEGVKFLIVGPHGDSP
jgi:hypothetical protein